jgi:hypothetical protein
MRMMNRDMTYHQWQQALGKPAEKVSKWFEDTIHSHLNTLASKTGGTVQREPIQRIKSGFPGRGRRRTSVLRRSKGPIRIWEKERLSRMES